MGSAVVWVFLGCVSLLPVSSCLQWTGRTANDGILYACTSQDIDFPWEVQLEAGETLSSVKWLFHGHSEELVAVYTSGAFLPASPYSQRVQKVSDTGLRLTHLTSGDSGNYTVEVSYRDASGSLVTTRSTVKLDVLTEADALGGVTMHVTKHAVPVYDQATHQYHIKLECSAPGAHAPPTSVIWDTPSGASLPGTSPVNGVFVLLLPNPVEGGNYTCHVAPGSPSAACLSADHSGLPSSSVQIDEVEVRLDLLEMQQRVLMAENTVLMDENSHLKQSVGFNALISTTKHLEDHEKLVLDRVTLNEGNGYDGSTGVFTAPREGTYFFTATSSSSGWGQTENTYARLEMMKGNNVVASLYTRSTDYHAMGTCNALLHLTAGQTVWLRSYGRGDFANFLTSFTGFMVSSTQ